MKFLEKSRDALLFPKYCWTYSLISNGESKYLRKLINVSAVRKTTIDYKYESIKKFVMITINVLVKVMVEHFHAPVVEFFH